MLILFNPVLLPIPNIHNSNLFCKLASLILLLLPIVSSFLVKLILKSHSFKISIKCILDHLLFISCCNLIILSGSSCGLEGVSLIFLPTLLFLICTRGLLEIFVFGVLCRKVRIFSQGVSNALLMRPVDGEVILN